MYKAKQKTVSLLVTCLTFLVTVVMAFACLFSAPTIHTASAAGTTETLSIFGTTGTQGTKTISWSGEHFTFVNNQGSSSTAIRTSDSDHYRVYQNSNGSISAINGETITQVVITCTSASYATVCKNSFGSIATASSTTVTITPSEGATSVEFTKATAQWRLSQIVITYTEANTESDCEHEGATLSWIYDSATKEHYQQCGTCEAEIESTRAACSEFTYGEYLTENGIHTRTATCTVCDGEQTESGTCQVTAGDYVREDNEHSQTGTCSICGDETTVTEDCTLSYTNVSNEDGTHDMTSTCSVCEKSVTETIDCTFEKTADGATVTSVCKYCEYTYTEEVAAWTVTYLVPMGVTEIEADVIAQGFAIALPTAEDYDKYTFVGWTTEEVEKSENKPDVLKGEYTPEDDVTLYALYSYSEGGSGGYTKVTQDPEDWSGEYLIVYEDGSLAFDGSLTTLDMANNNISVESATQANTFTIAKKDNGYTIQSASGYFIGQTSDANGLKAEKTTSYVNTISMNNDGTINIISGGAYLRYNATSNQIRFRYYKSSTYSGQKAICLYASAGTTYYTTGETVQPEPTPTPETKINGASITLGETLTMNYYVTLLDEHVGAILNVTMTGEEAKAVQGVLQENGQYKFSFEIPPQYMATIINAQLTFEDEVIAEFNNYSIKQYAQNQLNDNPNDELKQLLTDLLYYGDAAYNYVNETTDETPVTDGVENIGTPSTATPDTDFELVDNPQISEYPAYFTSVGVWFDNVNKLYVRLNTTENVTLTINTVEVDVTSKTVYTEGIIATDFDKEFVFVLSYNGEVMQTLTYSVNAYATAMGTDALALALYRYGASAEAYAN